ncbi:hypothetical protein Ciccas_002735 [Cichlidogyrus casuarinus]|uniref:Uncharacterized protein n=1 Tax=Cichlidogyrus casuarinus TaxID=1844966 RepID=A0ABD2QH11_9PLAT
MTLGESNLAINNLLKSIYDRGGTLDVILEENPSLSKSQDPGNEAVQDYLSLFPLFLSSVLVSLPTLHPTKSPYIRPPGSKRNVSCGSAKAH